MTRFDFFLAPAKAILLKIIRLVLRQAGAESRRIEAEGAKLRAEARLLDAQAEKLRAEARLTSAQARKTQVDALNVLVSTVRETRMRQDVESVDLHVDGIRVSATRDRLSAIDVVAELPP